MLLESNFINNSNKPANCIEDVFLFRFQNSSLVGKHCCRAEKISAMIYQSGQDGIASDDPMQVKNLV